MRDIVVMRRIVRIHDSTYEYILQYILQYIIIHNIIDSKAYIVIGVVAVTIDESKNHHYHNAS